MQPDVVDFGKRTQVCGVKAGHRDDEISRQCVTVSSRINSTWGGDLTDLVCVRRILEVIETEGWFESAAQQGSYFARLARRVRRRFPGTDSRLERPQPVGCVLSTCRPVPVATEVIRQLLLPAVIVLPNGNDGVWLRPAFLVVTRLIAGRVRRVAGADEAVTVGRQTGLPFLGLLWRIYGTRATL
ncbi:hypothetical protein A8144_00645 [Mycobacterium leprae 3125609]|nr:hypothetical protein A8144_00645 [Mycobacterium leprae 3125609]OAX72286.1 hypothetical protein A3216_00710 [Mycobacterium leprae 7935681]